MQKGCPDCGDTNGSDTVLQRVCNESVCKNWLEAQDNELRAMRLQVDELNKKHLNAISNGAFAIEMGNDERERRITAELQIRGFQEIVEELSMEAFRAARKIKLPGATDAFASDVRAAVLAKAAELMTPTEKRNDEGGNPWTPNKDIPAPTKPINENQPAFIQTPMGFGCRNCGRPPGGAGGCLICQRY